MRPKPKEPWSSFPRALDERLDSPAAIHCLGGFAITELYGINRSTADIDVLVVGSTDFATLQRLGGRESELRRSFRVYLDPVAVTNYPEDYSTRLIPIWPELKLRKLELLGLEAHDLALTKLERNSDTDREDVQALARQRLIDPGTLRDRYQTEFRPNVAAHAERLDLTLQLWIEMIEEVQSGADQRS